jgi:4-nitrophenyl phosphatase
MVILSGINLLQQSLEKTQVVVLDADGVLVEDGNPLPYAKQFVNYLKEKGIRVVVFTNNSTTHPKIIRQKYVDWGFKLDYILTSSMLSAIYCEKESIKSAFIVGEQGLCDILQEQGVTLQDDGPDAVVVGMDRKVTYEKLAIATRSIRNGSRFIATNSDPTFPTPRGLEPGAGTLVSALQTSTEKEPEIILGKPNTLGYDIIKKRYQVAYNDMLMIGDRYETDILGAVRLGIPSFIINSGVSATRKNPGKYGDHPEVPVIMSFDEIFRK